MDERKELLWQTGIVALGEALGVAAMIGIFALLGKFNMSVLWGGLVGGLVAITNFFAMSIGAYIAADKAKNQDVKGGQAVLKGSYFLRLILMAVVLYAFAKSGICNVVALVVPQVFVRFTMTLWEFFRRKPGGNAV